MDDIISRAPDSAAWTVILLFLTLVFGAPAIFSQDGAKKLWLLGRIHRWIKTKEERGIENEMRFEELQAKTFNRRLKEMETSHAGDLARLHERFSALEREFEEERLRWEDHDRRLQRELQSRIDYVEYLVSWIRKARLASEEYGWEPQLDKFYRYDEWLALRE